MTLDRNRHAATLPRTLGLRAALVAALVAALGAALGAAALPGVVFAQASPATATAQPLRVDVTYSGLQQWVRTRAALERVSGGVSASIEAVGKEGALVAIVWTGSREGLVAALRAAGLSLTDGPTRPVVRLIAG
jgi:hypothetical protein